ncbi:PREDICTED: acid-sensing ion channel 5-like [Priapulus caudatus]|uniref:Acid-sensing ion channel 5-like n=1 Tax=Priapulus caudatus TaxID=37621 RepID=A0ABM1F2N0_PRICU|nr:PREDICTED: acid-sensing ion channel 5-like [Priapulus caudatus]
MPHGFKECDIIKYFTCYAPNYYKYNLDKFGPPDKSCPDNCIVDYYNFQTSFNVAPSVVMSQKFNKSLDAQRKNMAILEVYYADIANTTVWTEPSYTPQDLICDIGGLMGAFAGASLLTILEVLIFIRPKRHLVGDSGTTQTIDVERGKQDTTEQAI